MITLEQSIIIPDTICTQKIDDEMVLMDLASENYFGLDEIACSIWQVLERSNRLQETYDRLLELYDVQPEILKKDLLTFVETLAENGLLKYQE